MRTTTDIQDSWISIIDNGFSQAPISKFATVGHWNDPGFLVVGKVSWGAALRDSRFEPAEQLTHITLWSILSAPLIVSCDMTQMDQFTKDLLTNTEVIDIDQDPLGKAPSPRELRDKSRSGPSLFLTVRPRSPCSIWDEWPATLS